MLKFVALCLLVASVYGSYRYGHPATRNEYGHGPVTRNGYGHAPATRNGNGYAPVTYNTYDKPQPYKFSYETVDDYHNTQSRQESGDEYGNKKGSYSQKNAEGLERLVEYIADEKGFRAWIKTNEPGTDNQDPADVKINANPIEVKETPKKVAKKVHASPSYGHRAYAAPVYGRHAYGTPAYGRSYGYGNYERNYGRTHIYEAKRPHGYKATGHASTTHSAGYGKEGYSHSVGKVHSRRYDAPAYGYGYAAHPAPVYRHAAPAYGYGYRPVAVKVAKKEQKEDMKEESKEEKKDDKKVRRY